MRRLEPEIIDYYNNEVVMMIADKYGLSQMEALKAFVCSKTHEMLREEKNDRGNEIFYVLIGILFRIQKQENRRCA